MTIDEAVKNIDGLIMGLWNVDECIEELNMAISTLREKQAKDNNVPTTNADRIRGMSNEEIFEFLSNDNECRMIREDVRCPENKTCKQCVGDWLNAEYKEGEE